MRPLRPLRLARSIGLMWPTRPMWTNANKANAKETNASEADEANEANANLADAKETDANKTIPVGCSSTMPVPLPCTPSQNILQSLQK